MNKIIQKQKKSLKGLCLVLFIFSIIIVSTDGYANNLINSTNSIQIIREKTISLSMKNKKINEILNRIQEKVKINFGFDKGLKPENMGNYSINVSGKSVEDALNTLFTGTNYTYKIVDDIIVIINQPNVSKPQTQSQGKIKGKVIDRNDNSAIAGATVLLLGTNKGAITDENGGFSMAAEEGDTLEVSYIGYKLLTYIIKTPTIVLKMERENLAVDDVVVTGIFKRKKEGFTGSSNKISNDELMRFSSGNVLRAIEMLDPGFRMESSNLAGSNPSSVPSFQMRGQSGMGDYSTESDVILRGDIDTRPNQPLFVLDGIIGVAVTTILDMDPAQIESITLLKDAAAMVLYGSRASNGVIVVETKAPAGGKLRVSYNGSYKLQMPNLNDYNLLNSGEKLKFEQIAGVYEEGDVNYKNRLLDVQRGVDTYWLSKPLHTVFNHRHGLNLEGGDQSLRYKIYFGYSDTPGVMKQTGTNLKSGSIDIRYRYKNLLISNIAYVDYSVNDRTSPFGTFSKYALLNPYFRYNDENGDILRILETYYGSTQNGYGVVAYDLNPAYDTRYKFKDQNKEFNVRNTFKIEYQPIDNLRLSLDASISKAYSDIDQFYSSNHSKFQNLALEKKGSYSWIHNTNNSYNVSFTASYNKMFANNHLFSVFARVDIDERKSHTTGTNATGFPNENMDDIFLGAEYDRINGNEGITRTMGMVATINYSYKQRYSVDFSTRVDASSEFGRNNRFAPFWSAGLRWNINKEKLFADSKNINELVFRATYGITGSQGFAPYQALQMYTYDGMMHLYQSSDVVGAVIKTLGNPDLKWQKTDAYNLGLDFSLFKNIISGRFEYYFKYTKNTLLDFSLAPSIGFTSIKDNMGNITNEGVEATLRIMPYNNVQKRTNLTVSLMGSHNKNTIKKISNALRARNLELLQNTEYRPLPRYEEGYSQNMIWVVRSLGIDPYDGNEVFMKRDGKMTNIYDPIDQIPYGTKDPKLQGSINLSFNWRGLSITVGNTYQFGGKILNQTLIDRVENSSVRSNVDRRALTERWKEPGDVSAFKAVSIVAGRKLTKVSSRFVMKNNEFLFTSMNVQYRFESKYNQFIKHLGLSSASVGLFMEDLGRMSTIAMERGIDYPFANSVSLSLNLVF